MGRSTGALSKTVFVVPALCKRVLTVLHRWFVVEILAAEGKESRMLIGTAEAAPVLFEGTSAVGTHLDKCCMAWERKQGFLVLGPIRNLLPLVAFDMASRFRILAL